MFFFLGGERSVFVLSLQKFKRQTLQNLTPDGIIGYSQGACVAAALVARSIRGNFPSIKFAILFAGDASIVDLEPVDPKCVPTLHVFGTKDKTTKGDDSAALATRFIDSDQFCHGLGHECFPRTGGALRKIASLIKRTRNSHRSMFGTP